MPNPVWFIPASAVEKDNFLASKAYKILAKLSFLEKIDSRSLVGLKIHFGEKGNRGYINPCWLKKIISELRKKTERVFLTDSNTLYVGKRSNAPEHLTIADKHGFSLKNTSIPVLIADGVVGRDKEEIEINLHHVKKARIASAFCNIDFLLCLNHFTGHVQTGIGAAIKNTGMGCASRAGKLEQHSDVHPWVKPKLCRNCSICMEFCPVEAIIEKNGSAFIVDEKCIGCGECLVVCPEAAVKMKWGENEEKLQRKMAEYAYAVHRRFDSNIAYINFLLKITKNCDCMSKQQPNIVDDIGIIGSTDPVALDQASADLVIRKAGRDVMKDGYDVDWSIQLEHGEKIGLGTRQYQLITL